MKGPPPATTGGTQGVGSGAGAQGPQELVWQGCHLASRFGGLVSESGVLTSRSLERPSAGLQLPRVCLVTA